MAIGPTNFTTHHKQIDAVSDPTTQVTEDNTTVVNGTYVVTKHSLGTHFDMNTSNNSYVNLEIGGLSGWRHIHGFARFSNYQTGGGQAFEFMFMTQSPGSSATYAAKQFDSAGGSTSSSRTVYPYWLGSMYMKVGNGSTTTKLQWAFNTGRYHPMCWFDFTVATAGSYSYSPDIGDIKIHATNTSL